MMAKKSIAQLLRRTHLLQLADSLMLVASVLKERKSNKAFLRKHPDFTAPPAALAFDAYNHTNWQLYHDMGLAHCRLISGLISQHTTEKNIKIAEWGCGPARVIRYFDVIEGVDQYELLGADYNEASIAWCNTHIKNARFLTNQLTPPLPLAANSLDCIYAISIFTHLSEKMHYAWIKELFRVLKPQGILIFTTHGEVSAKRLLATEKEQYDAGELVIKGQIKEGKKHYASYHPHAFVTNKLLQDYTIVQHIEDAIDFLLIQEVWVAKK